MAHSNMLSIHLFLILLTFPFGHLSTDLDREPLESDVIIDIINSAGTTWKAGRNFHPSLRKSYAKFLVNEMERPKQKESRHSSKRKTTVQDLPTSFDTRSNWPNCKSIGKVHDQGPCAASWAVASAAVMTDRYCVANEGYFKTPLSALNIMSCYKQAGDCQGSFNIKTVWQDLVAQGVVTGGGYHSHQGCQPYSFPECEHHVAGKRRNCLSYKNVTVPQCSANCTNLKYKTPYKQDIYKAQSYFQIDQNEIQTKKDLFYGGPLLATFSVYEDFLSYITGVYQYTAGRFLGMSCARILGWGVDNSTDFWLVANSWNTDWGDSGLFKIKRGDNECDFEANVYGAVPNVHP